MCDPTLPQNHEFHTLVHAGNEMQGSFLSHSLILRAEELIPAQSSASPWSCALVFCCYLLCSVLVLLELCHGLSVLLIVCFELLEGCCRVMPAINGLSPSSTFITILRPINQFLIYSLHRISAISRRSRGRLKNGSCSAPSAGGESWCCSGLPNLVPFCSPTGERSELLLESTKCSWTPSPRARVCL